MKTLIVLLLVCIGCGYQMPEEQEQSNLESEEEIETPKTVDREPVEKEKKKDNSIEVNVNVDVTVNQYNGYAEKWLFKAKPATWEEADLEAPEGYRLPTRVELMEGFDNGEFEGVVGFVVWSVTELVGQPGYIIGVNLGSGTESRFYEGIKLHVAYILD